LAAVVPEGDDGTDDADESEGLEPETASDDADLVPDAGAGIETGPERLADSTGEASSEPDAGDETGDTEDWDEPERPDAGGSEDSGEPEKA
jgi:nucleosome binding factor SPN SPT16 subunit